MRLTARGRGQREWQVLLQESRKSQVRTAGCFLPGPELLPINQGLVGSNLLTRMSCRMSGPRPLLPCHQGRLGTCACADQFFKAFMAAPAVGHSLTRNLNPVARVEFVGDDHTQKQLQAAAHSLFPASGWHVPASQGLQLPL